MVSPITDTIWLANYKDLGNGYFKAVGEKQDYTQEAVRAVYEWFMNQARASDDKMFEVRYGDNPWLTMKIVE